MKGCKRGTMRERNRRTFEDEEKAIQDTKNLFLRTLFEYCTALGGVSCYFIVDFLDLLDVRLYVFMEAQHFELSSFLIKYFTY